MPRLNDLGVGKIESPKIRPELIIIRKDWNFRDTSTPEAKAHIAWLKESIKESGVREPVDVEYISGEVFLVAGECRTLAAQQLRKEGWDGYIPVTASKADEPTTLANSIIDNGGLMPTILEFGEAFRRLSAYGWDEKRIAKYVPAALADSASKRLKFVKDALELDSAPMGVKDLVKSGVDGVKVSPALAVAATKSNRIQAEEIIREEAGKAKAAGKKVASRPKGEGKATKAKKVAAAKTATLEEIGDEMARLVLDPDGDNWSAITKAAKRWQKARG